MPSRHLMVRVICIFLISYNTFSLGQQYLQRRQNPSMPLHTLSYAFLGLEKVFEHVRYVGYYTDKNIEQPLTIAQYEQA